MITEIVVQKTKYECDKCGRFHVVESELEECYGKYEKIAEFMPEDFHEIEELDLVLCSECFELLKSWVKS